MDLQLKCSLEKCGKDAQVNSFYCAAHWERQWMTASERERKLRELGYAETTEEERAKNMQMNMLEKEARQGR